MPKQRFIWSLAALFALALGAPVLAQEKKDEKSKEPRILNVSPLAVVSGKTVVVRVRGLNIAEPTEVKFVDPPGPITVAVKSKGKVAVPAKLKAADVGDTEVELELVLPADLPPGEVSMAVVTADGTSKPSALRVFAPGGLIEEQEQNGGFRTAQPLPGPAVVIGAVQEANDVDVFRIDGKAGDVVTADVLAARGGSTLDALLTLYDERRQALASSDDADGSPDAKLSAKLPADGAYYVVLTDAQERGGATFPYLLTIGVAK